MASLFVYEGFATGFVELPPTRSDQEAACPWGIGPGLLQGSSAERRWQSILGVIMYMIGRIYHV